MAGLLNDLIAGNVMGMTSMEFAIVAASMHYNAKALSNQSFRFVWMAVCGLIALCTAVKIMINYIVLSQWMLDFRVVVDCFITACFYPFMQMFLNALWKERDLSDAG